MERFLTTGKIRKFQSLSQFGLGCLDLFRSKDSSIISMASGCSTPAQWRKFRKPFLFKHEFYKMKSNLHTLVACTEQQQQQQQQQSTTTTTTTTTTNKELDIINGRKWQIFRIRFGFGINGLTAESISFTLVGC